MKLKNIGRIALATGMSVALGLGTTSCSRDYVVAYVYATSAGNNSVSAYAVDYQSGVLTQVAGSPFTAGIGRNPVDIVSLPNGKNVYVISHDDSSVTEFAVGTDGKLYGQNTYNTTGSYPTSAAIDSTGTYLYVTFTYQQGFTTASPGPGGVTIFPINADGTLKDSAKATVNVGNNPVAIAVSKPVCSGAPLSAANTACTGTGVTGKVNVFAYVVDQEPSATGMILGFYQNTSTGALTPLSGVSYHAGTVPSAIAIDPTSTYAYVTDQNANQIYGYRIANGSSGNLTALPTSPYTTGLFPVGITIDPRGKYLMTANYNANSISSFSLNISDGSLSATASAGAAQVGTGPKCINIESALGIFAFTANSVESTVSGLQMSPNTGELSAVPNTPFSAGSLPSCITSVPNGSHTQSIVNP